MVNKAGIELKQQIRGLDIQKVYGMGKNIHWTFPSL